MSEVRYPISGAQRQKIMEAVKKLQREKLLLAEAYMTLQRRVDRVAAEESVVVGVISDVAVESGIPESEVDRWEFNMELMQFVPYEGA